MAAWDAACCLLAYNAIVRRGAGLCVTSAMRGHLPSRYRLRCAILVAFPPQEAVNGLTVPNHRRLARPDQWDVSWTSA
jgi:hypothetical protein